MNRVTFHPYAQAREVLSLYDYTSSELSATWYSDEETEQITQRCWKVVRKMDTGRGRKYCTRGLEGHSKLGSITKWKSRSTAVAAVLNEQHKQRLENDIADEQVIADAYKRTTSSCQMWAQVKGNQDRQAAENIYREDQQNDDEEDCKTKMQTESSAPTQLETNELNLGSPVSNNENNNSGRIIPTKVANTIKQLAPQQSILTARLVAVSS